jgi:putative Mg2+ transporter-C (MgtC) family protein
MPVAIGWQEVALRLALAVLGGTLLGLNRTERGMAAGLRTTLLVCLAAAVSMIQVNLLLMTSGRAGDSFVMMDLMRLPLGVLTGMGFIGAGAILRKGDVVTGVTTAATLWLATVLGLCFGGGQHGLGLASLGIGVVILWALKWLETRIRQERRATLTLTVAEGGPTDEEIRKGLESAGYRVASWDAAYGRKGDSRRRRICSEVHWQGHVADLQTPECVRLLAEHRAVHSLRWKA